MSERTAAVCDAVNDEYCLTVAGLPCVAADTESFLVGHKYEVSVRYCAGVICCPACLSAAVL